MKPKYKSKSFKTSDLRLVGAMPQPDYPPLSIGDVCRLNSGGPDMLVVDISDQDVVVAWKYGSSSRESTFHRACVRRWTS